MLFKALSVRQPYATYIEWGAKTVEIRSKDTSYRGPLLICSSKTPAVTIRGAESKAAFEEEFPCGHVICLVDLVDSRPVQVSDGNKSGEVLLCDMLDEAYDPNFLEGDARYAWVLENPRAVTEFIPVKGKLNFFDVELDEGLIESDEEARERIAPLRKEFEDILKEALGKKKKR